MKRAHEDMVVVSTPVPAYVTARELQRRLRIPPSTFWRLVKRGLLPQPVRIAPRCVRWRGSELEAFERRLVEDRGTVAQDDAPRAGAGG